MLQITVSISYFHMNIYALIQILQKFVSEALINNDLGYAVLLTWHKTGGNPLPEARIPHFA